MPCENPRDLRGMENLLCHEPPLEEFPPFPSTAALLLVYEPGSALEVSTKRFPCVKENKWQRTFSGLRTKKVMKTTKVWRPAAICVLLCHSQMETANISKAIITFCPYFFWTEFMLRSPKDQNEPKKQRPNESDIA